MKPHEVVINQRQKKTMNIYITHPRTDKLLALTLNFRSQHLQPGVPPPPLHMQHVPGVGGGEELKPNVKLATVVKGSHHPTGKSLVTKGQRDRWGGGLRAVESASNAL
jgi:hypothetical protein